MLLKKLEARAKNTIHRRKQVKAGAVFPDFSAFDRTQPNPEDKLSQRL